MITPQRSLVHTFAIVCLPFGAGYFLSYFYRSVNAVISGPLAAEFGLDASDIGLLTSVYFFGFAAFQLPLGVLLDRYGPRWVQANLILVAALGALVFSLGTSMSWLVLGRVLIGIGVSGGLMASFKVITLWFPPHRWPRVNGIFMAIGGLGVVAATTPVQLALDTVGWRSIFQALSFATTMVAVAIIYLVPIHASEWKRSSATLGEQARGLGMIFRDRLFWRIAPATCIAEGAGLAVQGLWSGPWFRDVAGLDPAGVAQQLLVMSIALTLGFVATGPIAEVAARFGINKLGVIALGAVAMAVIFVLLGLEISPQGYWVWFLFGFLGNVPVVAFPALSEHFGAEFAGRANTALNLVLFGTAFLFQYLIGAVIDLYPTTASGGNDPEGYRTAFFILVGLIVVSLLWFAVPHNRGEQKTAA
jgi:MFS family permease